MVSIRLVVIRLVLIAAAVALAAAAALAIGAAQRPAGTAGHVSLAAGTAQPFGIVGCCEDD